MKKGILRGERHSGQDIQVRFEDNRIEQVACRDKRNTNYPNQVLRSGCSIGANVEEAQAAHSKRDFIYRILIALREARETHYWLRLIRDSNAVGREHSSALISEAEQLKKVLGAIASKARGKSKASG